jgi:hypothetical protein
MILEQADMVQCAFDQRLGARLAIFFEQVLFQAAGIDPDADRAAIGSGGGDDFSDPLGRADVARVDAQAGRAGIGGFERALVVEMNVGDDRDLGGWTVTGASPPTATVPTMIWRDLRRSIWRHGRSEDMGAI